MTTFEDLPQYIVRNLRRIHAGMLGDLMAAVTRVAGPMDDGDAEKIVSAVLGPLGLVPPTAEQDHPTMSPQLLQRGRGVAFL
jgi:hypothetical protein